MSTIFSINAIPSNGLSLSAGVVTLTLGGAPSPAAQVGQEITVFGSTSVQPIFVTWQTHTFYPPGTFVIDSNGNTQYLDPVNNPSGGTTGGTAPGWSTAGPGFQTVDTFSTPNMTWTLVVEDISWSFDGDFTVTAAAGATIQYQAQSQFRYFIPGGAATGGGGTAVFHLETDILLESHSVSASPGGAVYTTTVEGQPGVFVITLTTSSPILQRLVTIKNNPNTLSTPILSKQYVRLRDVQTFYGAQMNGLYSILEVDPFDSNSFTQFAVQPVGTQFVPNDFGGGGSCFFLGSLTMATPPGLLDTGDASFAVGSNVTTELLTAINYLSKFGCLRTEVFEMGYYRNNDKVKAPTSPVDGYEYSANELNYLIEIATTAQVFSNSADQNGPFTPGTKFFPTLAPANWSQVLVSPYPCFVDQEGTVSFGNFTNLGANTWGAVRILAIGTRMSYPVILPVTQLPVPNP